MLGIAEQPAPLLFRQYIGIRIDALFIEKVDINEVIT